MTPSWAAGSERQAREWEERGHLIHYDAKHALWECWQHGPESCEAVAGGVLAVLPVGGKR